jgi:hypothetical protein
MNDIATHKDLMKPYLQELLKLNTRDQYYKPLVMGNFHSWSLYYETFYGLN